MLLVLDVGNTETKLGWFDDAGSLAQMWRVTTDVRRTPDEYGVFFTSLFASTKLTIDTITSVVISSVVPKLDITLETAVRRFFGVAPVFFRAHDQGLMRVATERPAEVGADLVATAIGARALYGAPLIVVSYGTATVFTAVDASGAYAGAAIAPGINISIDALVGRTAKLPQVALEPPQRAIGRNTVEALQSGILYGFVAQSEGVIRRFRAEMGIDARVIATGGLAEAIARHTPIIDTVDPYLSMQGLRLFHDART